MSHISAGFTNEYEAEPMHACIYPSYTAVVADKYPVGWRSIGEPTTKTSSFSVRVIAVNI